MVSPIKPVEAMPHNTLKINNSLILEGEISGGLQIDGVSFEKSTGVVNAINCLITESEGYGGATFRAPISQGNVDGGFNVGWDFSSHGIDDVISIRITPKNKYLRPGASQQYVVYGTYPDGYEEDITVGITGWSSSNSGVASISSGGLAKGIAVGKTSITATLGALSVTALVIIQAVLPRTEGQIVAFAAQSGIYRSFEYKTKRYRFSKQSLSVIKVIADRYPIDIDIIYPGFPRGQSVRITSGRPQRIRSFLVDSCEIIIRGSAQVSAVFLASSMKELPL